MTSRFEAYESIYWVFTQLCNDICDHCYNDSGPDGARITLEECLAIVRNLPATLGRLILSGGEPIADWAKLLGVLGAVRERYGDRTQVMLQTNGDLLTPEKLDALLGAGVSRFDVASMDRYHTHAGKRRAVLEELFRSRGLEGDDPDPLITRRNWLRPGPASYGFWGATEDLWLGGNWARGRAMRTSVWRRDGRHNFCAILSGARGFLGGTDLPQELSIQLWKINPCCPGTLVPLGDARVERVSDALERAASSPVWRKLNEGNPYGMGESIGIGAEEGLERAIAARNVCLWCDAFFKEHPEAVSPDAGGSGDRDQSPAD